MPHEQDHIDKSVTRPRLARTRFVEMPQTPQPHITGHLGSEPITHITGHLDQNTQPRAIITSKLVAQGQLSLQERSTMYLTQLSGMLRPLRSVQTTADLPEIEEDGYWPLGIQQIGPLPILNLYGREPLGRTLPHAVSLVTPTNGAPNPPTWQRVLTTPASKIALSLLAGLGLLALASLFVNPSPVLALFTTHLLTPQGIGLSLLAGLAYLGGHTSRALRWKFFLDPVGQVRPLNIVELSHIASLLNFLLPVRTGEAAKSLALKRIANIPINKSLPIVAIDKALDFLLALLIFTLVPLLGIPMDIQVWVVFGVMSLLLLVFLTASVLIAWKRPLALRVLRIMLFVCPKVMGHKIEGFVTGFVDALLAGVSKSRIFLPALLLTGLAVLCDGLFAMLTFWAIGTPIPFGTALFGYTFCLLFSILPVPPGQLGSYEVVGLLIFSGLLSLPTSAVAAMSIFSHLWIALLLSAGGFSSLLALGLTPKSAMRVQGA